MLNFVLPGLLACAVLTQAESRLRIGIKLEIPPSMSGELVNEVVRETERLWKFPALEFHWHHTGSKCSGYDNRLLIVRFRGTCSLQRGRVENHARRLGHTHVSDDHVLPFIEVDCDSVSASLFSREQGACRLLSRARYARALAVVLTHEMVHALTASRRHGSAGIMRPLLTPEDLSEQSLCLAPDTIENLEEALNVALSETGRE